MRSMRSRSSAAVRSRRLHQAFLAIVAWKALRQPMGASSSPLNNPSSRKLLFVAGAGALGSEFLVRRGTEHEMPVGRWRAQARRMRSRAELQRRALRRRAAHASQRVRSVDLRPAATSRVGLAVEGAVVLAAVVLAGTRIAGRSSGKAESEAQDQLPTAGELPEAAKRTTRQLLQRLRSINIPDLPEFHMPALPRWVTDNGARASSGTSEPESQCLARALARPSLLLVAMASCDAALRERGVLHRLAPETRRRVHAHLRRRAEQVPVPQPVVATGVHVRRGVEALWARVCNVLARVPAGALP
jgi:hypothetical protein